MYIKLAFKPVALIVLLVIPLIFGAASIGYAGGPQPAPEGFELAKFKAIDGLLTAVVVDPQAEETVDPFDGLASDQALFIVEHIVLICKEADVVYGPGINFPSLSPDELARTTAECSGEDGELCLDGWIFPEARKKLPACFEDAPIGFNDLIITKVKRFINTGKAISAEVTLQLGRGGL